MLIITIVLSILGTKYKIAKNILVQELRTLLILVLDSPKAAPMFRTKELKLLLILFILCGHCRGEGAIISKVYAVDRSLLIPLKFYNNPRSIA